MTTQRAILTLAVSLAALSSAAAGAPPSAATAPADGAPIVRLYDTGQPGEYSPLTDEELARREGWKAVAEGGLDHQFAGDAVFMNDQLAVVLGWRAEEVRVHSRSTGKLRAEMAINRPSSIMLSSLVGVKTVENSASAVALDANFGRWGTVRLRLAAGAFFLEARWVNGGSIWLSHHGKYVVLPDFFGDDLVYDATTKGQVPADNSLLALADKGAAIVACVWAPPPPKERVIVSLENGLADRIDLPRGKGVWIAVFEGHDIWRDCTIEANDAGRAVALDWKPPFAAKWRASLVAADASARSWSFRASAEGGPTTAAGDESACWFDAGRAMMRMDTSAAPAAPPGHAAGSPPRRALVLYPIDRTIATPLTTYCLVDLMRDALGVGPCQYVLDAEGLGQKGAEAATPEPVTHWIEQQFQKKPARRDAEAIVERLWALVAGVRKAQERIDQYRRVAQETREACRDVPATGGTGQMRAAVAILEDMAPPATASGPATAPASIPAQVEALADRVAKLAADDGAMERSRDALAGIRTAGARQDYELARLRMSVRQLTALWAPRPSADPRIERMIETLSPAPASRPAAE